MIRKFHIMRISSIMIHSARNTTVPITRNTIYEIHIRRILGRPLLHKLLNSLVVFQLRPDDISCLSCIPFIISSLVRKVMDDVMCRSEVVSSNFTVSCKVNGSSSRSTCWGIIYRMMSSLLFPFVSHATMSGHLSELVCYIPAFLIPA